VPVLVPLDGTDQRPEITFRPIACTTQLNLGRLTAAAIILQPGCDGVIAERVESHNALCR
jgi:hypothetical protein